MKDKIFDKKSTKTTTTGMEKKKYSVTPRAAKRKTQAVSLAVKLRHHYTKELCEDPLKVAEGANALFCWG